MFTFDAIDGPHDGGQVELPDWPMVGEVKVLHGDDLPDCTYVCEVQGGDYVFVYRQTLAKAKHG